MISKAFATLVVALSALTTCTLWFSARAAYGYIQKERSLDPTTYILTIVQGGQESERMQPLLLAEILGLSTDKPASSRTYDLNAGTKRLTACPAVERGKLELVGKDTLFVDLKLRTPVFLLGDIKDSAIDRQGFMFPLTPFFTPKTLPILYLGVPREATLPNAKNRLIWGKKIKSESLTAAFALLSSIEADPELKALDIRFVDTSRVSHQSLAKREIIVQIAPSLKNLSRHLLRLPVKEPAKALHQYIQISKEILSKDQRSQVVDLRVPNSAFLKAI